MTGVIHFTWSEQVEARTTVHLAFDKLESVDLPFCLSLRPGQLEGCFDGITVAS